MIFTLWSLLTVSSIVQGKRKWPVVPWRHSWHGRRWVECLKKQPEEAVKDQVVCLTQPEGPVLWHYTVRLVVLTSVRVPRGPHELPDCRQVLAATSWSWRGSLSGTIVVELTSQCQVSLSEYWHDYMSRTDINLSIPDTSIFMSTLGKLSRQRVKSEGQNRQ